jgi:hypothetical protein
MCRRTRWLALITVLVGLALAGCSSSAKGEENAEDPATVEVIEGSEVGRVTLTEDAANRIGLKIESVQTAPAATGTVTSPQSVVPLAALLYDKDGISWVYTNPAPLAYVRQRVVIDRVDGDSVVLRSGPSPGTAVVTVGGAELLGTEYVVEGE